MRVIITADDYGMCHIVDEAIDAGIKNNFISSTNVMVNMETFHNAYDLRKKFPHISVGIHFNVTTGRSILSREEIPTLIRKDGTFYPVGDFKRRFAKGLIKECDLEKELCAQYELFKDACGDADYWNTHENSSLSIRTFPVFAKVAKKYSIAATRTFQRVYYDKINLGTKQTIREFLVKNFFELWFTRIRKQFKMPNARIASFNKISKTEGNILVDALIKSKKDLIEVVFHPATDSEHECFGNISTERVKEYNYTSSSDTLKKYKEYGIEIANFKAL
ncbi:MAG: ChbG/HpnK family deacetylase [Clostridia bacterium]|nr:ChbG/HpnK family deacetylase [Clostridia bacterium]